MRNVIRGIVIMGNVIMEIRNIIMETVMFCNLMHACRLVLRIIFVFSETITTLTTVANNFFTIISNTKLHAYMRLRSDSCPTSSHFESMKACKS